MAKYLGYAWVEMSGGQQQRVAIAAFSKSTIRLLDGAVQENDAAH